ncbi:MAG: hypothetical protein ACYTET_01275 [Planctomycetota bacterium]|jgi:hypothetical protein
MKLKMSLLGLALVLACTTYAAEKAPTAAAEKPTEMQQPEIQDVKLPPRDSMEYWNIRSTAVTEFIPYLTKKRTEMKKTRQMLADYLIKIGKGEAFAAKNVPVPTDMKVYTDMLGITQKLTDANLMPKERPSWDQLVEEVAMKHVVQEGYLPTDIEEGDDAKLYSDLCKKKEEYGQKVRRDLRQYAEQAAKMWVYLDSINELDNYKVYMVDLKLEKKSIQAGERQMAIEQERQARVARAQETEERKFQDSQDRASFRSSTRERHFDARQDRLQYRQTRMDDRFVNGRNYYW